MNQRTSVESAVTASLHAVSGEDVSTALINFAEEHGSPYTANPADYTDAPSGIGPAFDRVRGQHQIIQASIGELASHRIVQAMTEQLDVNGSLLHQPSYGHDTIDKEASDFPLSQSLQQLLYIQNNYFLPAYDEVFMKAQAGQMPHAAIIEVGSDVNQAYRRLEYAWAQSRRPAHARNTYEARSRGSLPPMKAASLEEAVKGPFRRNLFVAAAALIGRGVTHDLSGSPVSKPDFIKEEFEEMSRLSSTVWAISFPVLKQGDGLLRLYSKWERGKISTPAFYEQASHKKYVSEPAFYHKSLEDGRSPKEGHCSADVAYTDLDAFPTAPTDLLRRFGIELPQHVQPSLTHLLLGGMFEIGKGTIFQHWPGKSGQAAPPTE